MSLEPIYNSASPCLSPLLPSPFSLSTSDGLPNSPALLQAESPLLTHVTRVNAPWSEPSAETQFPWPVTGLGATRASGLLLKDLHGNLLHPQKEKPNGEIALYLLLHVFMFAHV